MKIKLISSGKDVCAIRSALLKNPSLWDQNDDRTRAPSSPHHGLSDIWVRWADPSTWKEDGSHESMWYPAESSLMVSGFCESLMRDLGYSSLGGVLITKIPAGKMCKPHTDDGWHAKTYEKIGVQIEANNKQSFCFHGESLITRPGDVFWFDNSHEHWVTNDSDEDRVTMIVCMGKE